MDNINFEQLIENLKSAGEVIILSTDTDERFDEAKEKVESTFSNVKYIRIDKKYIDTYKNKSELFNLYKEIRAGKDTEEQLVEGFNNVNTFANLLVKNGDAHGIVSGATHATADILRPAFQVIKAKEKGAPISSFMWMKKENKKDLFMADISVNPNPDAEGVAYIAMHTADSVKKIFNVEPIIAMLSFSTYGSGGKHPDIEKVRTATEIVKSKGYEVYGEIQFDAAVREKVFESKTKMSSERMPNVFIFPDLDAGNIGYKIAATLGEYDAIGPVLQNINAPVNDLSRGATSDEIFSLVVITALQTL